MKRDQRQPARCPVCGGGISPDALVTEFCGVVFHQGCDQDFQPIPQKVIRAILEACAEVTNGDP